VSLPIKILLADDAAVVRSAVRRILETDSNIAIVGEVADLPSLESALHQSTPDILVLDLTLGSSARASLQKWKRQNPQLRILLITAFARDTESWSEADALLDKINLGEQLLPLIRSLAQRIRP
jgi:DNA-binding NarL/FixJ family response regulator